MMRRLSEAEWNVMHVLWNRGEAPLGEIVDDLKPVKGWSRNTVLTYLTRMEDKGLVCIERACDPHTYSAAVSREECARRERNNLLNRVYGGAAADMLAAFLKESEITEEERSRLRRLLDEMEV